MKRISLLSLAFALSIPAHTVAMADQPTPMQRAVAAFKQAAKKVGTGTLKLLANQKVARILPAATMLSAPAAFARYLYMSGKGRDMSCFSIEQQRKIEDEQKQVQTFVRSELANYGFANAHTLPVYYSSLADFGYMFADSKGIGISQDAREDFIKADIIHSPLFTSHMPNSDGTRKIIETWHNQTPEESQRIRDQLRAVIHHEAGHLKNKDFSCRSLFDLLLPISNYIASQKLISHLNLRIPNRYMQSLMIAGSAYPLHLTNQIITRMYSRYRERRADENIPNDPEILKGAISIFSKLAEQEKLAVANGEIIDSQNNLFSYLFRTHPTHEQRIARFQERLDALEKQNKMKEVL